MFKIWTGVSGSGIGTGTSGSTVRLESPGFMVRICGSTVRVDDWVRGRSSVLLRSGVVPEVVYRTDFGELSD